MAFFKKTKPPHIKTKGIRFDVYCPDENKKNSVYSAIDEYRAVIRQMISYAVLACLTSPNIDESKPEFRLKLKSPKNINKNIKEIFDIVFKGKQNDVMAYQLRNKIMWQNPSFTSSTWDAVRLDMETILKKKDPQLKISTIKLIDVGKARIPRIENIGIAILPKDVKIYKHAFEVDWDKKLGPVEFKFSKLDASRYHIWKNLVDKTPEWRMGTIRLNYHDMDKGRKLTISFGYDYPTKKQLFDRGAVLDVSFHESEEDFIRMSRKDKNFSALKISAWEAIGHLNEIKAKADFFDKRKEAIGHRHRRGSEGRMFDAIAKKIRNVTDFRSNVVRERNHLWTRKIVDHAVRQRCGKINFLNFPEEHLFGKPWSWYDFDTIIQYKAEEKGIEVFGLPDRKERQPKEEKEKRSATNGRLQYAVGTNLPVTIAA